MEGEVEFISKQLIKPSSQTPHHLRHYQLSFLDQKIRHVYNSMVYFFGSTSQALASNETISDKLKKSLSDVLTHYYPLAGRFTTEDSVDCNDEGVPYVEARARCQLSHFIEIQDQTELKPLLPHNMDALVDHLPLCVQLTFFECGGFAICAIMSHRIGDALSYFSFINSWVTVARSNGEATPNVHAHFISAQLFPPKDMNSYNPNFSFPEGNIVSKRFVVHGNSLEFLKAMIADAMPSERMQKPPSRVEALSAFIWSRIVGVTQSESAESQPINVVSQAVNLRPRMEPPLPVYSFGNYVSVATAALQLQKDENICCSFIKQLREGTKKIDKEYIERLRDDEHLQNLSKLRLAYSKGDIRRFHFMSLCRFPLYDVDFGWGKPIWVGSPVKFFGNTIILMDMRDGDGIEAYICLEAEDMAKLENDKEFRAYISAPVQSTNASSDQNMCLLTRLRLGCQEEAV